MISARRTIEWLERKLPVSRPDRASPWLAMLGVVIAVLAAESRQYALAAITVAVVIVILGAIARERKKGSS